MAHSRFSGIRNAFSYAYGVNSEVAALQVISGPNVSGVGTVTLAFGYVESADGQIILPSTTTPITIGEGATLETVVPTAVSNPTPTVYGTCTITATFAFAHGTGDQVRSGSYGVVEAVNASHTAGGGPVMIDASCAQAGLTNALLHTYLGWINAPVIDGRGSATAAAFSYAAASNGAVYTQTLISWY